MLLLPMRAGGEAICGRRLCRALRRACVKPADFVHWTKLELALWHEDAGTATGISRDADDDKFLALAVTGQADAIISGDRDLLDLVSHEGISIFTPAQFLHRLREPEA